MSQFASDIAGLRFTALICSKLDSEDTVKRTLAQGRLSLYKTIDNRLHRRRDVSTIRGIQMRDECLLAEQGIRPVFRELELVRQFRQKRRAKNGICDNH